MHQFQKQNFRQQGKSVDGKLAKGFIQSAHNKSISGSIPSKYETILIKNENSKAFGTSTSRFYETKDFDGPAPGQYAKTDYTSTSFSTIDTNTSISKNGYGNGFASKTIRQTFQNKYVNMGPGPGYYESLQNNNNNLTNLRTQSIKGSSSFMSKSIVNQKQPQQSQIKIITPGPSTYEQVPMKKNGNYSLSYNSAFISKSKRGEYMKVNKNPGAGTYSIKRSIQKPKQFTHVGVSSFFQPPIDKEALIDGQNNQNSLKKLANFIKDKKQIEIQGKIVKENEDTKVKPGPGDYDQTIPDFKAMHLKSQSHSNFKTSIKDRFGELLDVQKSEAKYKTPAPGHYKVEDIVGLSQNKQKALISHSSFVNQTQRGFYKDLEKKMGPNTQIPYKPPQKKSFHLNLANKWL
ncbi:hypothetical protein PPERSA_01652 [Pseudocohnilembus persalinus]|uniref:Sperm-tail PG-rich repeat n=1 Tax=Pseudocohnilembus persalinus TaxID=266149 RepID=A0A0V0R0X0_PSEPJ|nr:hypothetical protein PPERSA_01652 [Pseudocohnilembus persalinus]|eukprot:KRX08107.1 hypothetical protein PPERSA_01652 [Pseudocohnilembus persalinus]